jgi:hypothetical protein
MRYITVNDEFARMIRGSDSCVLCDSQGRFVGYVDRGFTADDIATARKVFASDSARFTTEQVLAHLQSLS